MMLGASESVRIVEVGPRDGLQNIREHIPTSTKLELIQRLEDAGLTAIELTSLVSSKAIPQLADAQDVLGSPQIQRALQNPLLRLPVLVPNVRGLQTAIRNNVKEVAVFVSATEGFSKANINCSVETGLSRAREVISLACRYNIAVRGYVSCIFEDPYEGPTDSAAVLRCIKSLLDAGCYEVSLGDTTGIGRPTDVQRLLDYLVGNGVPLKKLAGHFHDTRGQAAANAWEAYRRGIRVFDSSVGGLGGCPFAPGAKGNVATEDLVHMFHSAGIETGVDLPRLIETAQWISHKLGKSYSGRVDTALAIKKAKASCDQRKTPRISDYGTEGRWLYHANLSFKMSPFRWSLQYQGGVGLEESRSGCLDIRRKSRNF
ncbi:hypothetical protein N7468_004337 [Penicillium chermesinum]|uniref:hydroxymethylglutaryl-CoA lyase n=1 Tax=Penicillium chermesinum TaxID=63820 RepID=A0A9W9P888_9EURO|nr:uncharacterized protein N7468_004337 [Penicillium chermesinum]KAJ5239718.1 hypothetical protein N7468_004337 [Penicillium chermesinum]KAJ6166601.1 hypothetical protein N7470_002048 [Penicillium chermesinum]